MSQYDWKWKVMMWAVININNDKQYHKTKTCGAKRLNQQTNQTWILDHKKCKSSWITTTNHQHPLTIATHPSSTNLSQPPIGPPMDHRCVRWRPCCPPWAVPTTRPVLWRCWGHMRARWNRPRRLPLGRCQVGDARWSNPQRWHCSQLFVSGIVPLFYQ